MKTAALLSALLLTACTSTAPPSTSTPLAGGPAPPRPLDRDPQTVAQQAVDVVGEFRKANRPRIVDDVPRGTSVAPELQTTWCERLMALARQHVPRPGDRFEGPDRCGATLVAAKARQLVADVTLRFDVGFFFKKPYASASFERDSNTIFLPLSSILEPWDELDPTRHEWLHARHYADAKRGDALSAALMTIVEGKDYVPDALYVDEVPVNLCDLVRTLKQNKPLDPNRVEMASNYVGELRKVLDASKAFKKGTPKTRDGIAGVEFEWGDSVTSWIGGKQTKSSLALLEGVWKDATTALAALKASPPDVSAATAVPLLSGEACRANP